LLVFEPKLFAIQRTNKYCVPPLLTYKALIFTWDPSRDSWFRIGKLRRRPASSK